MKRFLGILVLSGAFMFFSETEVKAQTSNTWGDFRKPTNVQSSATTSPSSTSPRGAYNASQPEGAATRGGITFNKRYNTYETGQGAFRVRNFKKSKALQKMEDQQERGINPEAEAYKKRVRKMKRKYNK